MYVLARNKTNNLSTFLLFATNQNNLSHIILPMKYVVCVLTFILFSNSLYANASQINIDSKYLQKKYEAIVSGKIIQKKVKRNKGFYFTEYKLKTNNWIYKKPHIKESKYLTIKILGADLPKKGLIIKSSVAPDYIPINKTATFLLEKEKLAQKNTYTLSKGGVIIKNNGEI